MCSSQTLFMAHGRRHFYFILPFQPKTNPKRDVSDDAQEEEFARPGKKPRSNAISANRQIPVPKAAPSSSSSTYLAPPQAETPAKEELLKLVEQEESGDVLDEPSLKKMILNFEKRVLRNQELRVKFPDSPEKYIPLSYFHNKHLIFNFKLIGSWNLS